MEIEDIINKYSEKEKICLCVALIKALPIVTPYLMSGDKISAEIEGIEKNGGDEYKKIIFEYIKQRYTELYAEDKSKQDISKIIEKELTILAVKSNPELLYEDYSSNISFELVGIHNKIKELKSNTLGEEHNDYLLANYDNLISYLQEGFFNEETVSSVAKCIVEDFVKSQQKNILVTEDEKQLFIREVAALSKFSLYFLFNFRPNLENNVMIYVNDIKEVFADSEIESNEVAKLDEAVNLLKEYGIITAAYIEDLELKGQDSGQITLLNEQKIDFGKSR